MLSAEDDFNQIDYRRTGPSQILPELERSQMHMLAAAITWWRWFSKHAYKNQANQPSQESGLTLRSWIIP